MTNLNSKAVLMEISRHNRFVFKRLFDEMYPELVVYANEYLFDTFSSEDVVQEVFIKLWENASAINLKTDLKAYLYGMVRHRCLNLLKALKVTDVSQILMVHAVFDIDCDLEPILENNKRVLYEQVLQTMENLPAKMKTIVKLRFVNNYRYKEISEELGVSVNTVKTQLKRAKIKFDELVVILLWFILHF